METVEQSRKPAAPTIERPNCSAVLYRDGSNSRQNLDDAIIPSNHQHRCVSGSTSRNIEIDWREVDPYFSELSDCASFWTLINFTCDVIYSGLFVLFFIMGQDVESMFFEGLLNHINPILIYLIVSLIVNYGALRSLRAGREKCFLVFSVIKSLLFPITISLLLYLVFGDVQDYFGTFWVSFVVIVSCYNLTAALGLWANFICNKYILVNEAAQKRIRKQAKQQQVSAINERNFRCDCARTPVSLPPPNNYGSNQCSSSRSTSSQFRKVGDSSCANNIRQVCKPEYSANRKFLKSVKSTNPSCRLDYTNTQPAKSFKESCAHGSNSKRESAEDDVSFGEEDEVLQVSTVHKVMQEIRLLDNLHMKDSCNDLSDDGDSL